MKFMIDKKRRQSQKLAGGEKPKMLRNVNSYSHFLKQPGITDP
jgi:hypothetical protein